MVGKKNYIKNINGRTIDHYGLTSQKCSRGQKSVAIILSPYFTKAYHDSSSGSGSGSGSGSIPPLFLKMKKVNCSEDSSV